MGLEGTVAIPKELKWTVRRIIFMGQTYLELHHNYWLSKQSGDRVTKVEKTEMREGKRDE